MKFLKSELFCVIVVTLLLLLLGKAFAGDLPDPTLTPGVARTDITLAVICSTKWGKDARAVTESMKSKVYKSYGMAKDQGACALSPRGCEVDHLISRELGGADDVKNLWPQPYGGKWNAVMKDRLENALHKLVCDGTLTLEQAQTEIKTDWTKSYQSHFGE